MSELSVRLNAIVAALAAMYPLRVATREYLDFALRAEADLLKGVYTLVSEGEDGYTNVAGYNAQDGVQHLMLYGQLALAPAANEEPTGVAIEDAELAMVDEVKAFCRGLPESLCQINLVAFRQSQQLEKPYGWIACVLEYRP